MTKKARLIVFRILFVLYLAAVAYFCFGHFEDLRGISRTILGIPTDKVVHFCMFLPFPIMVRGSFGWNIDKWWKSLLPGITGILGGALLGSLIEYCQSLTTYRSGDLLDLQADGLGLIVGALAVFIFDIIRLTHIRICRKNY